MSFHQYKCKVLLLLSKPNFASLQDHESHSQQIDIFQHLIKLYVSAMNRIKSMTAVDSRQATRVMSSSRARSLWFSCTSRTSFMAFCWKPISWNCARRWRNSSAWRGRKHKELGHKCQAFISPSHPQLHVLVHCRSIKFFKFINLFSSLNTSQGSYWNGTYLGLTVLKHLQRFFNLSFVIAKFTKPITSHQISQDLQENKNHPSQPTKHRE